MEVPTATLMALSSSFLISVSSGWLVFKRPQYRPCRQRHNPGGSSEWGPQVRRQFSCLPSFSSAFPSPSFCQFWLILFHSIRYCVSIAVILNRLLLHPIILLSLCCVHPLRECVGTFDVYASLGQSSRTSLHKHS